MCGVYKKLSSSQKKYTPVGKAIGLLASQFLVLTILRFFFEKSSDCFRWLSAKTSRDSPMAFPTPHIFFVKSGYYVYTFPDFFRNSLYIFFCINSDNFHSRYTGIFLIFRYNFFILSRNFILFFNSFVYFFLFTTSCNAAK